MMEGSVSVSLTNRSGSGRSKNIWILRIRIRNTGSYNKKNWPHVSKYYLHTGTVSILYFLTSASDDLNFLRHQLPDSCCSVPPETALEPPPPQCGPSDRHERTPPVAARSLNHRQHRFGRSFRWPPSLTAV
jgi:hypothetical protein